MPGDQYPDDGEVERRAFEALWNKLGPQFVAEPKATSRTGRDREK
jgi:hypothetical protein